MRHFVTIWRLALLCVLVATLQTTAAAPTYSVPSVLEAGSSAVISGPFDGDTSNTAISVNGLRVPVERESDGACAFTVPSEALGTQRVALEEAGARFESEVVVLRITPELESASLSRGETTRLRLLVEGTAGLSREVSLDVTNESPQQIRIDGGDHVDAVIVPGRDTTIVIKIEARQSGSFSIGYELAEDAPAAQFAETASDDGAKTDSAAPPACGRIQGKVINKTKFTFAAIVVYVTGGCELCEPKPPCPEIAVNFVNEPYYEVPDDGGEPVLRSKAWRIRPSFFVIPKGCSFTLTNRYEDEVDEAPRITPNPINDDDRTLDIDALARGDSTTVTPEKAGRYLISSDWHKHTDGSMQVLPNACYSLVDSTGQYAIGLLPPGEYNLEVSTHPKRTKFPTAKVVVKANEVTIQDFVIER